jgi:thioredoxin-related protein
MKNPKLYLIFLILGILFPLTVFSQIISQSFEQLAGLQKTQNRFVVVFIHTDWCKYCQAMKNTTFKDKEIAALLNQNFWFVDLNAEEKSDITYNGQTYKFRPTGNNTGIHELVEKFTMPNGEASYPSICILNPDFEIIFQYNQLLSINDLRLLLNNLLKTI